MVSSSPRNVIACGTLGIVQFVGIGRVEVDMEGVETRMRELGWNVLGLDWDVSKVGWSEPSVCCDELRLD